MSINSGHQVGEEQDSDSDSDPGSASKKPHFKIEIPPATMLERLFSNQKYRRNHQNSSICCCSSSHAFIVTKTIALELFGKFSHVNLFWIKTLSRVLTLLCLPSICLFSLNHPHKYLYSYLLLFSIVVVSFVNLPPILLFLERILPILKFICTSYTRTPVVWSIGSTNRPVDTTLSGFLVKVYNNGDVYEGQFYKGKFCGSGTYYYHTCGRYEGDWVDNKYNGYGVETWATGSRYRGQYREGFRHGFGICTFHAGDVYVGEWVNGHCHGYGVHTCKDGSNYCGEFKGAQKHGLGCYNFSWHDGRRQGFGMYTYKNGDTQSGHWEDSVLSINPYYSLSVSYAKVLKAAEEARKLAEKAVAAGNIDEKVNRAVAAAYRAAHAARVAAIKAIQRRVTR